jgi:hypothetical protein
MFGEWYQKTNKTEDTNKLTLLAFKIIAILHNTRLDDKICQILFFFNLGASTSWNPQGLSRPVMGLLYLYLYVYNPRNLEPKILFLV